MKIFFIFYLIFTLNAKASETDQYLSWGHHLKDANKELSQYFNQEIEDTLGQLKSKEQRLSCDLVAQKIMDHIRGNIVVKTSFWVLDNPAIEKFPGLEVSDEEYWQNSIHHQNAKYRLVPLSRTINVKGVYFGIDKIGHFTLMGKDYYDHYLKWIKKDVYKDVVMEKIIEYGMNNEFYFLGFYASGVYSLSDLEANYQGLRFALDLCHGSNPILQKKGIQWKNVREMNFADYVNPELDESYTQPLFAPKKFMEVAPYLLSQCESKDSETILERFTYYQKFTSSLHLRVIRKKLSSRAFAQAFPLQSLDFLCPSKQP